MGVKTVPRQERARCPEWEGGGEGGEDRGS